MKWLAILLLLTTNVLADSDTATSTNILPNAGTASSSMDNFDLDGVNSGTGSLTNNSTHNGFTITCGTEIDNACGTAFNGELESSRDMKVSASGTLIGIDGIEASTTYTTTQRKLNGGIQLNSLISMQNCEWGGSATPCGQSNGAQDSYKLHIKIKDAQGNTLAEMTTIRLDDSGYYSNSIQNLDNLVYNGTGGTSYEWYWEGLDGEQSSFALRGPNLLGAELLLDFPIEDHEPLSTQEILDINEALNTVDLTENEIYDIISGLESKIEEEFKLSGNLEEGTRLEVSIENKEITFEVASRKTGAIVMESPMTAKIMEEMPIETLKEEMVAMVQEEMPFMEMMEELSPPPAMEEPPQEEEPKPMSAGPMVKEEPSKEEEPKEMQAGPMIQTESPQEEPEETTTEEPIEMAEKENEEPEEKESTSKNTTASVVSSKKNIKQKKVQSKKNINEKLEKVMTKIDKEIKNSAKNLQLKNLIKMDVMIGEQLSLATYENVEFYKPKSIYLDQLNIQDTRKIYADITLAKYTDKDIIGIKQKQLQLLDDKKQQLLIELEVLKNG
jgi:hypothetical protein